ncbi:MAG TPA: ribonuclease III [Candidatus Dojkabacteria bacterium]|nr:ribonuclease III [Candidatus Dojkabacteria bacterium]
MKKTNMNSINEFEERVGVSFVNKDILIEALTHRSYLNENKNCPAHNERLEFLGDAVLELVVSDYLFNKYSNRPEGELTSFRSALVKTDSLADTAKSLGIGDMVHLSKGEEDTGGRTKNFILANTFEALIGGIYIDQGYDASKEFVYRFLINKLEDIVKNRLDIDSKTKIQEIAQAKYKVTPIYEVTNEQGPDHEKLFTVVVKINNKVIGEGVGSSKQRAEEDAASRGVRYIEDNKD